MKTIKLFILILMFFALLAGMVQGQNDTIRAKENLIKIVKKELRENRYSLATAFIAGFAEGNREILRHDYAAFERVWPGANDNFWNPALSWRNKWKNGDPAQGEAFLGSTSILIPFTDGTHLAGAVRNTAWVATVTIHIDGKNTLKQVATDAILHWLAYSAGFNLTYHGLYGHELFKGKAWQ